MAATQILRVPRSDAPGASLLLRVDQQSQAKPLSLKLIATEKEHVYHGNIKESTVKSLQSSGFKGPLDEWKAILQSVLLRKQPKEQPESCLGLELAAAINAKVLTITLRKNISGIKERLGAITLQQDDAREEINGFEWAETTVGQLDDARAEAEAQRTTIEALKDEKAKLTAQLDDLVKAKQQHEQTLLTKFAALLNAKKLKIRDQQRELQSLSAQRNVTTSIFRAGGGKGKRKVDEEMLDESEGSDDGFAPAPVPAPRKGSNRGYDGDEGFDEQETPEPSDDDDDRDVEDTDTGDDESDQDHPAVAQGGSGEDLAGSVVQERETSAKSRRLPSRQSQHDGKHSSSSPATQAVRPEMVDDEETDDEL